MHMRQFSFSLLAAVAFSAPAAAEIISASPDHYVLRQEATSTLPPNKMWDRLGDPAQWWSADHTYSGAAENLSLDMRADGFWLEEWDGGSVRHGVVLFSRPDETLRLDAPFGPLQGMGVSVVWTITIEPEGRGSRVIFDEIATGADASKLDDIAPAVDGVKTQAINQLAADR